MKESKRPLTEREKKIINYWRNVSAWMRGNLSASWVNGEKNSKNDQIDEAWLRKEYLEKLMHDDELFTRMGEA